jgi:hypothetical protein
MTRVTVFQMTAMVVFSKQILRQSCAAGCQKEDSQNRLPTCWDIPNPLGNFPLTSTMRVVAKKSMKPLPAKGFVDPTKC